jgi:hypothetical protein
MGAIAVAALVFGLALPAAMPAVGLAHRGAGNGGERAAEEPA